MQFLFVGKWRSFFNERAPARKCGIPFDLWTAFHNWRLRSVLVWYRRLLNDVKCFQLDEKKEKQKIFLISHDVMRQSAGLFHVWVWAEIKVDFAKSLNCIYARMSINQAIYQTCHLFLGTQWELERDGSIWICSSFAVGHLIHIDTRNSPGPSRFIDKTDMRPTCDCLQRMWHFEAPQSVRKSTKLTTLRVFVCVGLCLIRSLRVSVCGNSASTAINVLMVPLWQL